jgi:serine/threonine protein kinase
MQYIRGRTLEEELQRTRRGYLPTRRVLRIGLQVIDVLSYLHRQHPPVIFRDLKPANIMLTRRGQLYLIDFGIARRFAAGKRRDTGPLGSPGYAAPEQYGRAQTDERSDIYGLGATLQTLLNGRDPLELRQGLSSLRPAPIPAGLQRLLHSMLERDPERRPQRVEEVEEHLARWVRRAVDWPAIVRGVGIGLTLWAWYALLRVGIVLIEHSHLSQLTTTPFRVRAFLVLLNLFPPAVLATALYQGISLVFRERSRRIQAVCVLILLVLLFLLAWLLGLAPLFKDYPFHSVAP